MATIFFLMWVSGAWKTTVLRESWLLESNNVIYVPSYTSRWLRPWEVDWEKYHHISAEAFQAWIEDWEYLEYAVSNGLNMYGTKYEDIIAPLKQQKHALKEIETRGLLMLKEDGRINNRFQTIFLNISDELMRERILKRWGDEEEVARRIAIAQNEREVADEYCDYMIDASQPLENVIEACLHIIDSYDL